MELKKHIIRIGAALLISLFVAAILLCLFAFILYKGSLSGLVEDVFVLGIYLVASLVGGFFLGRKEEQKRFLWGILFGVVFFLVVWILGNVFLGMIDIGNLAKADETAMDLGARFRILLLCALSGMVGGMLS